MQWINSCGKKQWHNYEGFRIYIYTGFRKHYNIIHTYTYKSDLETISN